MRGPLRDVLNDAAAQLAAAGVADPRREARLLLGHALGVDQATLLRDPERLVDTDTVRPALARRAAREPMALIIGTAGFWSLDLATSSATLVPRPDSEAVVEAALAAFPTRDVDTVLDLGTGTGCLLLAVLSECAGAFGVGVDIVPEAAALAMRNAAALGFSGRTVFFCGNWGTALAARFDLVLCNPPYIARADIPRLMPEVARYEPPSALDGGPDGLAAYRIVIEAMPYLLAPGGAAVLELGLGQAPEVITLAQAAGLVAQPPRADLGGIARALVMRRN
jgi:release factor glutamine methyltransferase